MTTKIPWSTKELREGQLFLGKVVEAKMEMGKSFEGKEAREQMHVQIKPLDHTIEGAQGTGTYHDWYTPSELKNSKWGMMLDAYEAIGVKLRGPESLVGVMAFFEKKKDIKMGEDINPIKSFLCPVEPATEADVKKAAEGKAEHKTDAKPATKPAEEAEDEPVDKPASRASLETAFKEMATKLKEEGMTSGQMQRLAKRAGIGRRELNDFIEKMKKEGMKQEEDGTWVID